MTDLVKRLREYRLGCGLHCSAYDAREPLDECIEAASRIEKLEAALREIVDVRYFGSEGADMECQEMRQIAREALEGEDD